MDLPFELKVHPNYLHIKHPPGMVIDPDSTQEMWTQVGRLCFEHGRAKVLIEAEKPEKRLDTMTAFDSGRILAENTSGLTIAMCFYNYEVDDLTTFLKTVAQNRGVRVEFFSDLESALEWLGIKAGELTDQPH
ncbi:MAG: hypothetical protein HOP17_04790 [Acidobacteria bacterium]|nr:hypothetical protein [Acidobacteriota bacterium]